MKNHKKYLQLQIAIATTGKMNQRDTVFGKTVVLLLLLLVSFDIIVVWGDESPVSTDGNESSPQFDSEKEEEGDDACLNYQCGAYSLASPLHPTIKDAIDRRARASNLIHDEMVQFGNFPDEEGFRMENPPLFLIAGVSCAFNHDWVIFDNDSIRRNNKAESMVWDADNLADGLKATIDAFVDNTNRTNVSDATTQLGIASEEEYAGISLNVPKDIQIRIYAIDNDGEFRYRSHPCNIIAPLYVVSEELEFGNRTFENATTLEFVWNYTASQKKRESPHLFGNLFSSHKYSNDATLELWIPNRILETTTIMGPKYDYSLAIEVNGDLVDTARNKNDATSTQVSKNITNITEIEEISLLAKRPPQKLTIWNDGINTKVAISIDTFSIGNITNSSRIDSNNNPSNTELSVLDRSLNGVVEIRTDSNVHGLIQLDGSNTRASIVRDDAPMASDGNPTILNIFADGFRQILTVIGNHGTKISLGGISIALYTTEDCSKDVSESGNHTGCMNVDSNFTGEIRPNARRPGATMMDNYGFIDLVIEIGLEPLPALIGIPASCLVPTNFFQYNCNPLASGAILAGPIPYLEFAGLLVAWIVAELLV